MSHTGKGPFWRLAISCSSEPLEPAPCLISNSTIYMFWFLIAAANGHWPLPSIAFTSQPSWGRGEETVSMQCDVEEGRGERECEKTTYGVLVTRVDSSNDDIYVLHLITVSTCLAPSVYVLHLNTVSACLAPSKRESCILVCRSA